MNLSLRRSARSLFGSCLVLLASSCLTPPSLQTAGGATASNATAGNAPAGNTTAESTAAATPAAVPSTAAVAFTHTASELTAKLRLGWNLGNSMDVPDGETAWGNPMATPELFAAVAKAGFHLVRIPVTWARHTGPGPAYTISSSWFQRLDQIIGYAKAAGLYCVVNLHHDGADGFKGVQWLALKDASGNTTDENNAIVRAHFVTIWTQIAKHYSAYGEELLFESMNEVHDGYGKPDPRHYAIINDLNQEFVKLVRASGGNNDKRLLVVPGYNTNIDQTIEGFKLPEDTAPGRLVLSVHYYDPYLFALEGKTHTWGSASPGSDNWGQEDFVVKQFDKLKANFIDKGVGVLMGEYGATHQSDGDDYRRYYVEYVTKAAVDRGMLPVFWDNGASGSGGEKFGLMDRRSNKPMYPDLMEALQRAATSTYSLADVKAPSPK